MNQPQTVLEYLHEQFPATVGHIPLADKVLALSRMNAELAELLRDLEFVDPEEDELASLCPSCWGDRLKGHRADCRLAAALKRINEKGSI